jgi:putative tricarboxylic transport membrane protein
MFEAFFQGLSNIIRPDVFLWIVIASWIAVIVGVIPAISGGTVCILVLPFLYGVDPMLGLPILCCLIAVSCVGGSMTAILLGIPGDNPNAASVLDGFSMTRKGEGGRALGIALTANVLGGMMAVALSFAIIPILVPIIMAFRSPELFLIIIVALLFLSVLSEKSRIKGLISGLFGILISCIGFQASTGAPRLTFGNLYLYSGLHPITILLGMLALPVMIELHALGKSIAPPEMEAAGKLNKMFQGAREVVFYHKWLWFRSVIIGYIVGIMPALGSAVGAWAAYGQAKKTSKHPEKFGTGIPEGIIAPESASNACHAGDLLTTLAFGIPGSGVMVILLAAFVLMGIQPGPKMIVDYTALCFTMLITVAAANLIAGATCFFATPLLIKVTRISPVYLFATLIPIIGISVFVVREYMIDMAVVFLVTILGISMNKFGFSPPSLLLGFILGDQFEYYLTRSLSMFGPTVFFTSPICLVLIALIVFILAYSPVKQAITNMRKRRNKEPL